MAQTRSVSSFNCTPAGPGPLSLASSLPYTARAAAHARNPCHASTAAQCQWRAYQQVETHRTALLRPQRRRMRELLCSAAAGAAGLPSDAGDWGQDARQQWTQDTLQRMVKFILPALVIPLCDPLISVVDTICISQFAGTRELAAMGPALVVFSFCQYVFNSLQVSTISLIGERLRDNKQQGANEFMSTALFLAITCGTVVLVVLMSFPERIITLIGADSALVPLSASYMRIRALAQPAMLTTMVCTSSLLAQRDSLTPLVAVVLSVVVSLIGNLVAVAWLGMGLEGAAGTTVATQIVSAVVLLYIVSTRSVVRPTLRIPTSGQMLVLLQTMGPISIQYLCKNLTYIMIGTVAASLDVLRLAAHQAVYSLFNLAAFANQPIEQVALTFLPAARKRWQQHATVRLVVSLGICMGVFCGSSTAAIVALQPQVLTQDPGVWPFMRSVAPQMLMSLLLAGVDVGCTGILLAKRDLNYVARSFAVTLALVTAFTMYGVKAHSWGLGGVWAAFVLFFAARCIQSGSRLAWLLRQEGSSAESDADGDESMMEPLPAH